MRCLRSGWILIDRSGKHFGSVLCFIRDGSVSLPKGRQAVQEVLAEAKYYDVQGLVELCHNTLQVGAHGRFCRRMLRETSGQFVLLLTFYDNCSYPVSLNKFIDNFLAKVKCYFTSLKKSPQFIFNAPGVQSVGHKLPPKKICKRLP